LRKRGSSRPGTDNAPVGYADGAGRRYQSERRGQAGTPCSGSPRGPSDRMWAAYGITWGCGPGGLLAVAGHCHPRTSIRVALPYTGICLPLSRPPGRPLWTFWERLPSSDCPCLFPGCGVVRDAGKATPQFYGRGEFTLPLVNFADRGGVGFGNHIHAQKVAGRSMRDKRCSVLFLISSLHSLMRCTRPRSVAANASLRDRLSRVKLLQAAVVTKRR
jgi:hypothetical protein